MHILSAYADNQGGRFGDAQYQRQPLSGAALPPNGQRNTGKPPQQTPIIPLLSILRPRSQTELNLNNIGEPIVGPPIRPVSLCVSPFCIQMQRVTSQPFSTLQKPLTYSPFGTFAPAPLPMPQTFFPGQFNVHQRPTSQQSPRRQRSALPEQQLAMQLQQFAIPQQQKFASQQMVPQQQRLASQQMVPQQQQQQQLNSRQQSGARSLAGKSSKEQSTTKRRLKTVRN
jgi:hypothetical protein